MIINIFCCLWAFSLKWSHREELPETQYTWSSRGPTPDGHQGVSVSAPGNPFGLSIHVLNDLLTSQNIGGAISPVPTWLLTKSQLMNGTSMASPNCCGGITLLISALKVLTCLASDELATNALRHQAQGIKYTPYTIKRAIENSARKVPSIESFALGNGLLQVNDAYHHLLKYSQSYADPALHFEIDLPLHHGGSRGVYLR